MNGNFVGRRRLIITGIVLFFAVPPSVGLVVTNFMDLEYESAVSTEWDPRIEGGAPEFSEAVPICESAVENALDGDYLGSWEVEERLELPEPPEGEDPPSGGADALGCALLRLGSPDHKADVKIEVSYRGIHNELFVDEEGDPLDLSIPGDDLVSACMLVERDGRETVDNSAAQERLADDFSYCLIEESENAVVAAFVERGTAVLVKVGRDDGDVVDDVLPVEKAAITETVTVRLAEGLSDV